MSLWKIAWRSIQQRALASTLTAISMGLGVALVVAVLVVYGVVHQSFRRGGEGYDLVVGKKGDTLDLVLNTVYYLRKPVGNLPGSYYWEFVEGEFAPDVELVVPVCMGHSYEGFRVVGTTPDMFHLKYLGDREYTFADGENFKSENPYDAVIGSTAARETGLKVGSRFKARHGVDESAHYHKQEFTVVGVLEPTGTPNDRALFVNMEGFYRIHDAEEHGDHGHVHADHGHEDADHEHGHADHGHEHADHGHGHADHGHEHADEHADHDHAGHDHGTAEAERHEHEAHPDEPSQWEPVTALLVCVDQSKPALKLVLERKINEGTVAQAVTPSEVVDELFEGLIGNIELILLIMAVLIVVVAGLGIMVSIYNSMSDRRHEIAVMRALGASRLTVMIVILLESILLSLGGGVLGLALGHGLIALLSPVIVEQTGVAVGLLQFRMIELVLIPGLIVLASVVGYLPAVAAYRTDVARSLTATQ
jgi:putative ABC transport system permease protein